MKATFCRGLAALVWSGFVATCAAAGCDEGGGGGGEGGAAPNLDWFTSSCAELGGVETAQGACFIACESSEDCPLDTLWCPKGDSTWVSGQCEIMDDARGCGPSGWRDFSWGCYLACSAEGNDSECPADFRCVDDSINHGEYFCTGQPGGGANCGEPCPSGCCSPSGVSCCEPPFCSGDCAGSPCC